MSMTILEQAIREHQALQDELDAFKAHYNKVLCRLAAYQEQCGQLVMPIREPYPFADEVRQNPDQYHISCWTEDGYSRIKVERKEVTR
jgi:uncharacterized coiled-coil DUF342 family protein